jgi:hypothetical protein
VVVATPDEEGCGRMASRDRKRRSPLETYYWELLAAGVGTVEACRQLSSGGGYGYQGDHPSHGPRREHGARSGALCGLPHYDRARTRSVVAAVNADILTFLNEFPTMPATVIAERMDWPYSVRELRDR